MIKLRIIRPGQPDEIVEVEGNRAVIGRASDCDIVVNEEYVSGRHLMVLSGFVVVDLDSTNGTFIDGARLGEATVVGRREFQMGNEKTDARIELIEASADLVPQDANAAHLELLQERDALLREVESLRAQLREREESQGTDESSDGHRDSEASGDGPGEGRIISLFERLVRQRNSEDGPDAVERGSSRRSLGSSSTRL